MKTHNSLAKRLLAFAVAFVMVMGMLPMSASAAPTAYGTVETITSGGQINGTEVSFEGLNLRWIAGDASIGRADGWWVGIKAIAPEGMNVRDARYTSNGTEKSFWGNKDSSNMDETHYIELWGLVDEQILREANSGDGKVTYEWTFDWNGDHEFEQSYKLIVDSVSTVLLDASGAKIFPVEVAPGTVTALSEGGVVDGSHVSFRNQTLNWVAADTALNRQEGWWVGIKVTAPEGADIENAQYTSNGVKKSFNANKDSVSVPHYIELWGMVQPEYIQTALETDGEINYIWTFDWNNDGLFEQNVTMALDVNNIKLMNKDGKQVYPELGAVSTLTGGTVVGSATSDVTVTVEDTTLYYSPADDTLGRSAGWWVGIKMTAPAHMTEEQLMSSTYQVKNGPNAEWSAEKSFFANKDSQTAPFYIGLWFPVTPESLEKFAGEGRNMTMWYRFDWDHDGIAEQNITFSLVPSENIRLLPGSYALTFKDSGANTLSDAVGYAEGATYDFKAELIGADDKVGYAIVSNGALVTETEVASIDANGLVTVKKPGEVILRATRTADAYYQEATAECTLTVTKASQTITAETPVELTYTTEPQNLVTLLKLSGVSSSAKAVYTIAEGGSEYAQIENGSSLKLLKAGEFDLDVYVPEDDYYMQSSHITVHVSVAKAEPEFDFAIENAEQFILTYGEKDGPYTLTLSGAQAEGADVTYKISNSQSLEKASLDNDSVVQINGSSLSLYRSGTVTITAVRAEDDRYASGEVTHELTVERGQKEIEFEQDEVVVYYGAESYDARSNLSEELRDSNLSFSILLDRDMHATIDPETGVISFNTEKKELGTLTVNVTRNQDAQYVSDNGSFTVTVAQKKFEASVQVTSKSDAVNGWYTEPVTLRPTVDGWQINCDSDSISSKGWGDSREFYDDGEYEITCYLKDPEGTIFLAGTVNFKIDSTHPSIDSIEYTEPTLLDILLRDEYHFFRNEIKVIVTATDATSGMKEVTYQKFNEDGSANGNEGVAEEIGNNQYTFPIEAQFRGFAEIWAWDNAGLKKSNSETDGNTLLVADNNKPVLSIMKESEDADIVHQDPIYTNDPEFSVLFRVADENYDLKPADSLPVITVEHNGEVTVMGDLDWSSKSESRTSASASGKLVPDGQQLEEGEYLVTASFTDPSGNTGETKRLVIVDYTAPVITVPAIDGAYYASSPEALLKVSETYFHVNQDMLTVTVTYTGADGQIESSECMIGEESNGEFPVMLPAFDQETDYTITVSYTDPAGNGAKYVDAAGNELDYTDPTGNVGTYAAKFTIDKTAPETQIRFFDADMGEGIYTEGGKVILTLNERNFFGEGFELAITAKDIDNGDIKLENGELVAQGLMDYAASAENWKPSGNGIWTLELSLTEDARYSFDFSYTDPAGWVTTKTMVIEENGQEPQTKPFEPQSFIIDGTAPDEIEVAYAQPNLLQKIIEGVTFGFYQAEASVKVTAVDKISGVDTITLLYRSEGSEDQMETAEYVNDAKGSAASATFKLSAETDEQYRGAFLAAVTDCATNEAEAVGNGEILVMDIESPELSVGFAPVEEGTLVTDRYAEDTTYYNGAVQSAVRIMEKNFFEGRSSGENNDEIIHKVTMFAVRTDGKTYGTTTVTEYMPEGAAANLTNADETEIITWAQIPDEVGVEKYLTGDVVFEQDGHYVLNISYTDFSNNEGNAYTSKNIVVDTMDPRINLGEVAATYNTDATITITVTEHNFNAAEFVLAVQAENLLDDNDAAKIADYAAYARDDANWKHDGEVHTLKLPVFAVEAAYVLTASYTDMAGNSADTASASFLVDKVAPVVTVTFDNTDVQNKVGSREYYKAKQSAVITVNEHNFVAANVEVDVTGVDVTGKAIALMDYAAYARNDANWMHRGDEHILELSFDVDANYHFEVHVTDPAGNENENKHARDFTVDKEAPKYLNVSYDSGVNTSAGTKYYNDRVKVTISAEEAISGLHEFVYSYVNNPGVSGVNKQLLNEVISAEHISRDGTTFTATFYIPKDALTSSNQFNGTVRFHAVDWSENASSELKDDTHIVVDNIRPNGSVSFNTPVSEENGVSYYDGAIQGTISITEANFDKNDVIVSVTKDGATYNVAVNWSNGSGDRHTGSFVLSEDGEYVVTVSYKDKSNNTMNSYTSGRMTVDTVDPAIKVYGVTHESANNDETIGVVVEVSDRNVVAAGISPVLSGVIKVENADNTYTLETIEINLGEPEITTNANGETVYRYTVENLEQDGYYTLVCQVKDHAGRTANAMSCNNGSGSDQPIMVLNFSVNRKGSSFWITTEHTMAGSDEVLKNQANGSYISGTVKVVIHESNVDPVDMALENATLLTLNDGTESRSIDLIEGENYQKNVILGVGGWYENTYTLDNSCFENDGTYSVNLLTYDKAENSNVNTNFDKGTIRFVVDRSLPVISANIEDGQQVKAQSYNIEFTIADANLDELSVVAKIDGEIVEVELIGDNLYSIHVGEITDADVEISATDKAGNIAELFRVESLTVSTNPFVLWYTNPIAVWGTIALVAAVGFFLWFLILKKKKEEEEAAKTAK